MNMAMTVYCPKCGTAMVTVGKDDKRRFECAKCLTPRHP
jgi:DNA-directed RNA polymerase subunit M/transcription elongation factor TFIIS